jgi:hypothetical protein
VPHEHDLAAEPLVSERVLLAQEVMQGEERRWIGRAIGGADGLKSQGSLETLDRALCVDVERDARDRLVGGARLQRSEERHGEPTRREQEEDGEEPAPHDG